MVSPAEFIPLLEDTGLIVPVGAWVLSTAARQLRAWRQAGAWNLRVSVNLSARQFEEDGLLSVVESALVQNALPPDALELEITESLLMGHPKDEQSPMCP